MDKLNKLNDEQLDKVSGGTLKYGLCEFNQMDASKCEVGSYAITTGNLWYQCKVDTDGSHYWYCTAFPDDKPKVIEGRPRNSNE